MSTETSGTARGNPGRCQGDKGLRLKGRARVDRLTKRLVQRLRPNEIAVIDHPDLDGVAAEALLRCRPRAVVNASLSVTGRYPNPGPLRLLQNGVPILDAVGPGVMEQVREEDEVEIVGAELYCRGHRVGEGRLLTIETVEAALIRARADFPRQLARFVENTLCYALEEVEAVLGGLEIPPLEVELRDRQVLVVVRGEHYREDLRALRPFIREGRPILVAVDGGAEALLECGYRPHLIVGDMDSIGDAALNCGAELVVHAYPDGRAPGLERVRSLGLTAKVVRAPGTSEDLALLLAYQLGASLIVTVGSHFSVLDFLSKGRQGMASTLLTRLKVGSRMVDAKGVSVLYRQSFRLRLLLELVAAALVPALTLLLAAPVTSQLLRLAALRLRLALGV
ncbi:MAG: putative cytokinetic ring protein SteA [Moorellales bacterium]